MKDDIYRVYLGDYILARMCASTGFRQEPPSADTRSLAASALAQHDGRSEKPPRSAGSLAESVRAMTDGPGGQGISLENAKFDGSVESLRRMMTKVLEDLAPSAKASVAIERG